MVHLSLQCLWPENALLTPRKQYLALTSDEMSRRATYKKVLRQPIEAHTLEVIRLAWQSGTPLGSDRFRLKIEMELNLNVGYSRQGRLRKQV